MRLAMVGTSGGTGRTTLVLELGIALTRRKLKVLMVDLDPQGGLGMRLAREDDGWQGLADLLMGRVTVGKAVKGSNQSGLWLLPRGRLDPRDAGGFQKALRQPRVLEAALRHLERRFDVLLLDLPSGVGLIPRGGLSLSTHVLVTFRAEPMSARSVSRTLRVIDHVCDEENPDLSLMGVVATFVNPRSSTSQETISDLRSRGVPVLDVRVPVSDLFVRASELGQPVRRLAGPRSRELSPILDLADLIESHLRSRTEDGGTMQIRSPWDGRSYERFSSERFEEKLPLSVHEDAPGGGPNLDLDNLDMSGLFGSEQWQRYLEACLRATGGETAFAVDDQGLPVASCGKISHVQIESLGTRLAIAFDQASRMEIAGGSTQATLVEFDHLWLTGLAVEAGGKRGFTLGILGREPVTPRMRKEIRGTLKHLLADVLRCSSSSDEPELSFGAR